MGQGRWTVTEHGRQRGFTIEHLGFIPSFTSQASSLPLKEQIDYCYSHGGGWFPYKGFKLGDKNQLISSYPEEPDLYPLAEIQIRDEQAFFYDHSWVAIVQPDRSYEVARID